MPQRFDGIVIRSIPYSEKSIIATVYTASRGRISIICNTGSKKSKTKLFLQAFCKINFQAKEGKGGLLRASDFQFSGGKTPMLTDVRKNAIRFFLAEFLQHVIVEEEENNTLFQFLSMQHEALEVEEYNENYLLFFMVNLFPILGIQPNAEEKGDYFDLQEGAFSVAAKHGSETLNTNETRLFRLLLSSEFAFNRQERKQLLVAILNFFRLQLGIQLQLKSLAVLESIFE